MALTTTTLLNGLKSLFGASSSAPASTSRIPYCNSSNEVTGSTSLTDLASVLGGVYKRTATPTVAASSPYTMTITSKRSLFVIIYPWSGASAMFTIPDDTSRTVNVMAGGLLDGSSPTLSVSGTTLTVEVTSGTWQFVIYEFA